MADTALRHPAQSSPARRTKRSLNPIIEEDSDEGHFRLQHVAMVQQSRRADTSHLKIEAWLSPMSDHFPTPRGNHYLAAPVLPSSPSSSSANGSSPTVSSNPWNRVSVATTNTEFEDLYDVTDEEDNAPRRASAMMRNGSRSLAETATNRQPTRLVIPESSIEEETRSALEEFKKLASPVPITPSAQLPMSPAQMRFMDNQQALAIPTISAPPSLDGSLNSDQLAAMSAPVTPVIGDDEGKPQEAWSGVHLQPGALATLHAISNGDSLSCNGDELQEQPSQVIEVIQPHEPPSEMRQQPLRVITSFLPASMGVRGLSPNTTSGPSLAGLTRLDIPSPGGFFEALSPRTRTTWHMLSRSPEAIAPPTSATAEQFYRAPWNIDRSVPPVPKRPDSAEGFYRTASLSPDPIEQVVEVINEYFEEDNMPTARPVVGHESLISDASIVPIPPSPEADDSLTEIVIDYDPNYARKQQLEALANFDRTEMWLSAQRVYLKGVDEKDDDEDENALETISEESEEEQEPKAETTVEVSGPAAAHIEQSGLTRKKTVRFSNMVSTTDQPRRLPSKLLRQESAYYRAFQDYIVRTQKVDVFVHQLARFESLQAQRVSLREAHRNQLLGKYQLSVVPLSAKKRLSTNVARGDDNITDDLDKLRREKEFEAMSQMAIPTWHVAAMKFLNGGRLIMAPVTKRLARLSHMAPGKDGVTRDRARILDLGGQSTCDWAWHCALMYPNTKIYTCTTKAIRQLSNANIRGPPNHRQVAVPSFSRLPFADNQFDLVSARELHSILKFTGENGEDEWNSCLKECMRVLKPGGYLEFSLLDSDIINAGPLGLAKSVEFGFSLKTLGYDPSPSKLWLGRLARAGFQDIRRTWLCLPLGAKRSMFRLPTPPQSRDSTSSEAPKVCQMDAMVMGSSDNVASVCSIVGGWSWERWLLRCEMEKVAGELRLVDTVTAGETMKEAGKCLDGVHAVMEEGRECKAGFRMLNGYARKPRATSNMVKFALVQ